MMSAATHVLLLFTAWTLLMALVYVGYRAVLVLSFKERANAWMRGAIEHQDPVWVTRFSHAHLNCLETLPLYAAVVLFAYMQGQLGLLDSLAYVFLGARIFQSVVHIISTSPLMVFARANGLFVQWALLIYWLIQLMG